MQREVVRSFDSKEKGLTDSLALMLVCPLGPTKLVLFFYYSYFQFAGPCSSTSASKESASHLVQVGINERSTLSLFLVTVRNPFNNTYSHLLKSNKMDYTLVLIPLN